MKVQEAKKYTEEVRDALKLNELEIQLKAGDVLSVKNGAARLFNVTPCKGDVQLGVRFRNKSFIDYLPQGTEVKSRLVAERNYSIYRCKLDREAMKSFINRVLTKDITVENRLENRGEKKAAPKPEAPKAEEKKAAPEAVKPEVKKNGKVQKKAPVKK